jgi:hypothetical protein
MRLSLYHYRMAKISMSVPDDDLAEIDAYADGNRTAFMVAAALERARVMRRAFEDAEIAELCATNAASDPALVADWETAIADGLD